MGGKSHHSHRSNISRDMRLMHPEQVHDVVLRLTHVRGQRHVPRIQEEVVQAA